MRKTFSGARGNMRMRVYITVAATVALIATLAACNTEVPPVTEAPLTAKTTAITEAPAVEVPPEEGITELVSIKDLNKNSTEGSHANDNYLTSSLEINFRESIDLRSSNTGATRYDNA